MMASPKSRTCFLATTASRRPHCCMIRRLKTTGQWGSTLSCTGLRVTVAAKWRLLTQVFSL